MTVDRRYGVAEGLAVKAPCRLATTADHGLSGLAAIDGVTPAEGDRVLVWRQDDARENGIWVASSGNWTRALDFDGARDVVTGTRVFVTSGATHTGKEFVVISSGEIVPGREIQFIQLTLAMNVRMTGAVGDGMTDDTDAFSAAAHAAPAIDNVPPPWNTVPHPPVASVLIPAGTYLLTALIDTGGREITWIADQAAEINGAEYLNGALVREGQRTTRGYPSGMLDQATGWAVSLGGEYADKPAPVTGVADTQAAADYPQRDMVALSAAAYSAPALVDVGSATYTPTTATISALSADQVKRLRAGMIVTTKHVTRTVGILVSWNADGSVLTVTEWREAGGSAPVSPANGTGLTIGFDKIYAINGVANLEANGYASQAIAQELSVRNRRGDSGTLLDDPTNRVWGYLAAAPAEGTAGYYKSQAAYIARGNWLYGFVANEQDIGFYYRTAGTKEGFRYRGGGNAFTVYDLLDDLRAILSQNGDWTLGSSATPTAGGRVVQFRTSGHANGYDSRIRATGGDATIEHGTLNYEAANHRFTGKAYPASDGLLDFGATDARWANVFAANFRPGDGTAIWSAGNGSPEGVVTAPIGSLYARLDGVADTALYIKESGAGDTGWAAIATPTATGLSIMNAASARAVAALIGAPYALARGRSAVGLTGSTSETTLATISVPADALGPNGKLSLVLNFSFASGGAPGTRTPRVRLGSLAGTAIYAQAVANNQNSARAYVELINKNATNAQFVFAPTAGSSFASSSTSNSTAALDTTTAFDLLITGQLANGGDTLTLEAYDVNIHYGG